MKLFASASAADQLAAERAVRGERGVAVVAHARSLQSQISSLLAIALMLAIGIGFLAWYYGHLAARPTQARQRARALLAERAQSDMALPSLGLFPPQAVITPATDVTNPVARDQPPLTAVTPLPPALAAGAVPQPSALERRLSGAAFATVAIPTMAPGVVSAAEGSGGLPAAPPATWQVPPQRSTAAADSSTDALPRLLKTDIAVAAHATLLPDRRLLLPKGAFIDCTLETAIDSTLPGLTTCVTATDTFGADGTVVLLERGTKLIGETRGQIQQGAARVFVVWTEARTPVGVVVPLDSPGSDELGRSGLPGEVNRHFWQRFGAAILISTIDGTVQAAVRSSTGSGGTVIYSPSDSQQVMTEVLKDTVNIAPTVTKNNGDRIQVLVARDVDFSSVYELRHVSSSP
jgi:type IV secretion system protein VirB10